MKKSIFKIAHFTFLVNFCCSAMDQMYYQSSRPYSETESVALSRQSQDVYQEQRLLSLTQIEEAKKLVQSDTSQQLEMQFFGFGGGLADYVANRIAYFTTE